MYCTPNALLEAARSHGFPAAMLLEDTRNFRVWLLVGGKHYFDLQATVDSMRPAGVVITVAGFDDLTRIVLELTEETYDKGYRKGIHEGRHSVGVREILRRRAQARVDDLKRRIKARWS